MKKYFLPFQIPIKFLFAIKIHKKKRITNFLQFWSVWGFAGFVVFLPHYKNWTFGPVCSKWCWCATFKVLMQLNRICLPRILSFFVDCKKACRCLLFTFVIEEYWKHFQLEQLSIKSSMTEKAIYLSYTGIYFFSMIL